MIRSFLKYAFVFAASFFLLGLGLNIAIRSLGSPPYMGLLSEKIDAFQKNKDQIDILFIGTSRTFRQMNTPLMEERLRAQGCGAPTLFNMGVPNLTYSELDYVLDSVIDSQPERLKMVVIGEPMPAVRPQLGRLRIDRIRYFSSIEGTLSRIEDIYSYQESVTKKLGRLIIALIGFTYEQTNIGHLSRHIFPELYKRNSLENSETKNMPDDWMPTRGYFSLQTQGHVNNVVQKRHDQFLEKIADFSQILDRQKNETIKIEAQSPSPRAALFQQLFTRLDHQKWQHGLYLPPLPDRIEANAALIQELKEKNPATHYFYYNNPQNNALYWDSALWFDEAHLNDIGSAQLSSEIADQLCSTVREWGI